MRIARSRKRAGAVHGAVTAVVLAGVLVQPTGAAAEPAGAAGERGQLGVVVDGQEAALRWEGRPGAVRYLVVDERTRRIVRAGSGTGADVPLPRGSSADLLVAAVDARGAEPIGKVLVTNPARRSGLSPLAVATTSAGTRVSWGTLKDVADFRVSGPEPSRRTVPADDPAPSVDVAAPLGGSAEIGIVADGSARPAPGHRYGVRVTPPGVDVEAVPAGRARTLGPGDRVPAAAPLAKSVTAYETFIPEPFLDVPESPSFPCNDGADGVDYWFSGDGRDVGDGTGRYRTRAAVHHDWSAPRRDVAVRDVRASHRYVARPGGELVHESERTASDAEFTVARLGNDGLRARDVIRHSVGNPYCAPLLNLDYTERQDLYRTGGHWIRGIHDRMPDHQLYRTDVRADGSVAEEPVFRHRTESPACLEPGACSPWRYQYVR